MGHVTRGLRSLIFYHVDIVFWEHLLILLEKEVIFDYDVQH